MKQREINEGRNGTIWVPDTIADWDAPSSWERERLASMEEHLRKGMTLIDVGTEHGWMTAVYGQFVGPENVVLCEPGREMWTDIGKIWRANGFKDPLACWPGFVGETRKAKRATFRTGWPDWIDWDGPESPPMAYDSLNNLSSDAETTTIDVLAKALRIKVDAITIDVEGAEWLVLKGAVTTFAKDRPLVWASVHPDLMQKDYGVERVEEMFDWMDAQGYKREYLGTDHEQHNFWRPL